MQKEVGRCAVRYSARELHQIHQLQSGYRFLPSLHGQYNARSILHVNHQLEIAKVLLH